ncbi:peptidase domain-containing ABC transporter [Glaciecola siphonariae]|uniref:Peptidase domain-containing ABC transporter n=1 Tax=Glaciecola siphonariae TaxID=521012 RepID=A0ABV9LWH0_9ALTE
MHTQSAQHTHLFEKLSLRTFKRLRLVMQNEANECGMACLTMIANYHGNGISLSKLRLDLNNDGQGVNLKTIIEQAARIGMSSRALKVPLEELNQLQTPAILHWNFSHFVVLKKMTSKGAYIADPALGMRFINMQELSQSFTGVALELMPNQDFTQVKADVGLRLRDFAKNAVGIKRQLLLLLGLSLMLQLFAIVSPFYMQTVVDEVLIKADEALLTALAIGFALVLCIDTATQFLRERLMLVFSMRFSLFLSSSVFSHLLSLPIPYFIRRHMGDIVSRFDSVQHIRELITSGIITAIIDGLMALITLAVMLAYSVKLTLVVIALVLAYSLLRWIFFYPVRRLNNETLHAEAEQQSYFMQSVRAIRTLKLSNSTVSSHAKWLDKLSIAMNKRIAQAKWNIRFTTINKVLFGIENLVVVYLAALLVLEQSMSVGMLFAFVSYKTRFVDAMSSLIGKWIEFKMLSVHLNRVADILLSAPEQSNVLAGRQNMQITHTAKQVSAHFEQAHSAPELPQNVGSRAHVSVNNLAFSYGDDMPAIFENVSFELAHGQSLAIVGQSGCGKSTLLNCLLGLLKPLNGEIIIDGQILTPDNRSAHHIGAVLQDDQLLTGSVLENISQFDEQLDLERAVRCAHIACIHEDIMGMTMQYQSTIGDMGDSLSGGQKQRLLIARALYQQPKILLLDEASSHLDGETEKRLNEHLKHLDITKIMIAHRQETIASAQHIIKLTKSGIEHINQPQLIS